MIPTIVLTSLMLTHDVVYGHYHVRNASHHKYGPNVCAVEEAPTAAGSRGGVSTYRGNRNWPLDDRQPPTTTTTCGQNKITKYDCCEGFKTAYGRRSGCTGVKPPKNVLETARELGAREFVRHVQQQSELYDLLTAGDSGPYTIFVPTDEAFAKIDGEFRLALDSYETAVEILKYHVVPRRIVTQNVSADETLNTLNDGLRLRLNKYSTRVETINCVTIIRKNGIAQNGVVHLINAVLSPYSYSNRNLVQIINQNRELTIFSKMLEVSRVHQNLKETFQTLTALVPTDSVLQRFPQNQLRRILKDETLSKAFVLKHLLPTPVCLSAVTEEHYVKSLAEKHYVKFSCDGTNSVTVQGNRVNNNDLKLLSNGMLYVMNFALSAEEGKSAWQTMQNLGLSEFVQIVNVAGLAEQFENVNSLTVFAPTNKAIRCMNSAELYHVRSNPSAAAAFVDFHVGRETIDAESIYDGKVVESLATGKRLRLQCVLNDCAIEGQRIGFQTPAGHHDGAAVHVVDKPLFPPTISVEDFIRKNESFSLYAQAMDLLLGASSSAWTPSSEFGCGTSNTYFVPTDYAFRKLDPVEFQRIFGNPNYLRSIMNNHQVNGRIVPSALIKEHHWQYEIQTKNAAAIVRVVNSGNKLMVNNAEIIEADIMTTNGLIHIVDDLISI